MTARVEIWGVEGIPEVEPGDDIGELLIRAGAGLRDGDIVVVTSKVVSKAEDRLVRGSREEHLAAETVRVVARRGDTQIVETRHGFVMAAAGIDASNVPAGTVALLPVDSDASAIAIHQRLRAELGIDVAVIISDTMGRPWRDGVIDTAIGAAGLDVLWDLRGQRDTSGQLLEATVIAIADELASAADLVKGKLASTPVAVIRGFPFTRNDPDCGARPLIRPSVDDMFRLGTRESRHQLVADAAPLPFDSSRPAAGGTVDVGRVQRAVHALGPIDIELSVAADGTSVSAHGDPLAVGLVLGRLLSALAAEDLRGSVDLTAADATATIRIVAPDAGSG